MRFIGLDLAWGSKNTTGAVALEWHDAEGSGPPALSVIRHADNLLTDDEIVDFVRESDDDRGIVVGIDAPLDVPNESGERPVEATLRRCFGLDGDEPMTLVDIGAALGVTRERARQIKVKALETLCERGARAHLAGHRA